MSKAPSTIVRWKIPDDLYNRLKFEASKRVNMPVATYALNMLQDSVAKLAPPVAAPVFTSVPHTLPPAKPQIVPKVQKPVDTTDPAIAEWDRNNPEPARAAPEITIRTPDDYSEAERERIVAAMIAQCVEEDGE